MTKTAELQSELIVNPKWHLKGAENRPRKEGKRRYERRKANEYLRGSQWAEGIVIY
jgi:hypothetical protein